jgi:VanZ family protein
MTPPDDDRSARPDRPRRRPLPRLAFAVALATVLVASLLPPASLPPVHSGWDKADHALAWLALGLLGMHAWPGRATRVMAGLLAYGGAIELLQGLSAWRQAEWADLVADGIGLAAALAVQAGMAAVARYAQRRR